MIRLNERLRARTTARDRGLAAARRAGRLAAVQRRRDAAPRSSRRPSTTGCGTPTSSPPTRSAPTRSHAAEPRPHRQDHAVRLGRLLDQADHRVHLRHRAGRVHRPPVEVPPVRRPGQVLPLDDLGHQGQRRPDASTSTGLADLWIGQDGKRYGLPKDWDTVALFYNNEADRGGRASPPSSWTTWTGTRRTAAPSRRPSPSSPSTPNGKRGDEPGFDKTNVKAYGLGLRGRRRRRRPDRVELLRREQRLAVHRQEPVGHQVQLRRPQVPETIAWWTGLIDKGYMPVAWRVAGGGAIQTTASAPASTRWPPNGSLDASGRTSA